MTNTKSHNEIVSAQFGDNAQSYVDSPVHAAGADLEFMKQLVGKRLDDIALDLGCGGGHVSFQLSPLLRNVVAADLSPSVLKTVEAEALRRGLTNISTLCSSAENLPTPTRKFDLAVTRFSAHHWRSIEKGLCRMREALKPEATAIFIDTITSEDPLLDTWLQAAELFRDPSHVRDYSPEEWKKKVTAAGFRVMDTQFYSMRLEFASWTARSRTSPERVLALKQILDTAPNEVREAFKIEQDGSFAIRTMLLVAQR